MVSPRIPPRVLLIDDNRDSRELYRHLLEWAGLEVETAANGLAGLRAAQTRPPDVILLDLLMPGLDGGAVLRRLRLDERTRSIPVIALTGVPEWLQDYGRDAGFDGMVRKPAGGEELIGEIRRVIGNAVSPPR